MRISLLILTGLLYCQVYGQSNLKVYVEDYNKDGVADTLKTYFDGGSGYGGKFVELVNGKTNEVHRVDN